MDIFDINKVKSSGAAKVLLNACTLAKSETVTHIYLILDSQYRVLADTHLIDRLSTDVSKTLGHRAIVHVLVNGETNLQMPSKQHERKSNTVNIPELARISDLERELPYKKSWIWLAVRQGRFPPPVRLGRGCTVWTRSSVEAWLAAKVSESKNHDDRSAVGIVSQWVKPKGIP